MDPRPCAILDQAVAAAAQAAWVPRSGQRFEFVGQRVRAWVRCDPGQIGRIVGELVRNAADAIGENGRVQIAVELVRSEIKQPLALHHFHEVLPPGMYARLSVTDDGPGIRPEIKARLFEPFVSTKPPGIGVGMGLATVYGIAKSAWGHVDAESEPGRTVFSVYLPLASLPLVPQKVIP